MRVFGGYNQDVPAPCVEKALLGALGREAAAVTATRKAESKVELSGAAYDLGGHVEINVQPAALNILKNGNLQLRRLATVGFVPRPLKSNWIKAQVSCFVAS